MKKSAMKMTFRTILKLILCSVILSLPLPSASASDFVLKTLETELQKNFQKLKKGKSPPYFLSYLVTETEETTLSAGYGAIENSSQRKHRKLDTEIRVGSFQLDNTHRMRGRSGSFRDRRSESASFPVEDDETAFRNLLWSQTDKAYKNAIEKLIKLKTQKKVKTEEEDPSPDFSAAPKESFAMDVSSLVLDRKEWEGRLKKWSALFKPYPEIHESGIYLTVVRSMKYLVTSDGTRIQTGHNHVRLSIQAQSKAEDGMEFTLSEHFDGSSINKIPAETILIGLIRQMAENLLALRTAPPAEPFSGPAILSGKASAVFFHEILGHRLEGHRQKDEGEGQTFAKKIGELILPDFVSVLDDPSLEDVDGTELNGKYLYDDEGIKSGRTFLVEKGILKNFLMSRSPVKGFGRSNGHGRKQTGYRAVARQGNLIVKVEKGVSAEELRTRLKKEILRKNKAYGLFFKEIQGGFTMTGRVLPNAFNVRPVLVYKVFADNRPDQMVRGVDLIGTPLTPLSKIILAADKNEIFNGYCGAESGYIPVSAVSPAILIEEIEVQKKEKSEERVPILKPPLHDSRKGQ